MSSLDQSSRRRNCIAFSNAVGSYPNGGPEMDGQAFARPRANGMVSLTRQARRCKRFAVN